MHLGQINFSPGGAPTELLASSGTVLGLIGTADGSALVTEGAGFFGYDGDGVALTAANGHTGQGTPVGVRGLSDDPNANPDVESGGPGIGVEGRSGSGVGVLGVAIKDGAGVEARCGEEGTRLDGLALSVRGKSAFSTVGSAVIPAGQNSVFVANPAVTPNSHISVTLVSDPGPRQVRWVRRRQGAGFGVHLTPASPTERPETALTYMIVEPA